jgi:lipid A 3-O-deacylase
LDLKISIFLTYISILLSLNLYCIADESCSEDTAPSSTDYNNFTLYWENDFYTGTDQDYTNGIKLTWSSSFDELKKSNIPAWSAPVYKILPFIKANESTLAYSFSIGQDIYTPQDTNNTVLISDDRPYAGYTYIAAGFHSRRDVQKNTWEIQIGIVGPAAYAETVQNAAHDLIGDAPARGWKHQLNNEITIDAIYESQWRAWSSRSYSNFALDLIPHLGARIGTVNTYVNGGVELRMGWNLPNDFGSCPIRAGCEISPPFSIDGLKSTSLHLFFSTDGKIVAHDIFLDGNNFRDSHSVNKKPLVGEFVYGISWQVEEFRITYSIIFRSKQFDTQIASKHDYGSLNLSYSF